MKQWFEPGPQGIGIICGKVANNLFRIDIDNPDDLERLKDRLPKGAPIFKSQRPGGGYGVLLRSTTPIPKLPEGTFKHFPRLGINGEGSYTVVPRTLVISG